MHPHAGNDFFELKKLLQIQFCSVDDVIFVGVSGVQKAITDVPVLLAHYMQVIRSENGVVIAVIVVWLSKFHVNYEMNLNWSL